jgi:hypothetical protein
MVLVATGGLGNTVLKLLLVLFLRGKIVVVAV